MSTEDIVIRLRRGGGCTDVCRVQDAASGCECAESADEIEHLRFALREIGRTPITPTLDADTGPDTDTKATAISAPLGAPGWRREAEAAYWRTFAAYLHRILPPSAHIRAWAERAHHRADSHTRSQSVP